MRLGRPLDLPPGKPEQEVYAHLRDLAARNVSTEDEVASSAPGMYDHYVPALIDSILSALGVPDAVHAVPAGDLPGRAAGDVRVPDGDLRADRAAGLQRVRVRGPDRARRRGLPREAAQQAHALPRLRAACTRTARETLATTSAGWGTTIETIPLADGVDRRLRRDRRRRRRRARLQHPNFLGAVEDLEPLADAAHEAGAL